jgi:hypothetical protein
MSVVPDDLKDVVILKALMGQCGTAEQVEEGMVKSPTTPEEWHELCPVGIFQAGKWRVTLCVHEWHERNPKCRECRRHVEGDALDATSRCLDREDCIQANQVRLYDSPGHRAIEAIRERVEEVKASQPKRERTPTEARPTSGSCHHCGAPTKGGKFVAGHDAKLKGELIREAEAGSAVAVAEQIARGWLKAGRFPTLEKEAEAIVQATPTHELIERRNAERANRWQEEN